MLREEDGMDNELPQEVQDLTRQLRTATDDFWPDLRERLGEKGIDVGTSWLAEFFPDQFEFYGMIVTADCRTLQFEFGDFDTPSGEWVLGQWNDRTARAVHLGATDEVKQIMRILGSPK